MKRIADLFSGPAASPYFYPALVGLFFFAGYFLSLAKLPGAGAGYFLATLSSAIAGAAAAYELGRNGKDLLAAWLALLILLVFGYFKFYLLLFSPLSANLVFPAYIWPSFAQKELLLCGFFLYSIAFAGLCSGLLLFSRFFRSHLVSAPLYAVEKGQAAVISKWLLVLIISAAPACLYAVHQFHVGVPGLPAVYLPMRLSGVLYYSQTILLPGLILAQIYAAALSDKEWQVKAGLLILVLWAYADALLRTTRGSLLLAPLLIVFLSFAGGLKIKPRQAALIALLAFVAVCLLPFLSKYRLLRTEGFDVFQSLLSSFSGGGKNPVQMFNPLSFVLFRIPGFEILVAALGTGPDIDVSRAWGVLTSTGGLAEYITRGIFGIRYLHSFAPSFVAGSYLLGGYFGVLAASVLASLAVTLGWRGVDLLKLRVLPVARVFFLLLLFWIMTEGPTGILFKQVAAAFLTILVCEFIFRAFAKNKRKIAT